MSVKRCPIIIHNMLKTRIPFKHGTALSVLLVDKIFFEFVYAENEINRLGFFSVKNKISNKIQLSIFLLFTIFILVYEHVIYGSAENYQKNCVKQ